MPRTAALILAITAAGSAHADCELPYAPPEVRAAALAFHHRTDERRGVKQQNMMRKEPAKSSRKPVEASISSTPAR